MPQNLFPGGGEMGERIRSKDWSSTPVGPISTWPESLKTAVRICLGSRYPLALWWGKTALTQFYNDAYIGILGSTKHPGCLGASARECWQEIWHILEPMLQGVFTTGEATWSEDFLFILNRKLPREEGYFTFSYSVLPDDCGAVGGIFCAVQETTGRVIGERRLRTLRDLGRTINAATTVEEACRVAVDTLTGNAADIPVTSIYLLDGDRPLVRLVASSGFDSAGTNPGPIPIGEATWPLERVLMAASTVRLSELPAGFDALPAGPWPEPVREAMIIPIQLANGARPAGFLVAGFSPRLLIDADYLSFLDLIAGHLSNAIANVRNYQEERQRAEMLAELDRTKTDFFNNVSHEFRTPLTLILAAIDELLGRSGRDLSPHEGEVLRVAHRNGLRLIKLVDTLLDFARIEAGRMQCDYEATDIARFTTDVASSFRSAMEKAGLRLEIECSGRPELVYLDRDLWEKVVLNLLSNAFKFTLTGVIAINVSVKEECVEVAVADTGIGIPEAELAHVFDRFHQVKGASARTHEGTGIGLALVQEIVKLHGGSIAVASKVGEGSRFTITLPRSHQSGKTVPIGAAREAPSTTANRAAAFTNETLQWLPTENELRITAQPQRADVVYIAEDNSDMRDYLRRLLSPNYNVETYLDGAAAWEAVKARPPDLLLSDILMPRVNGSELLQLIRSDSSLSEVRVIMLSARAGDESKVEGLSAGADDYVTKPFTAVELLARVKSNLDMARTRKAAARQLREAQKFESLGILAGGIAHDFNNILTRILLSASALQGKIPDKSTEYRLAEAVISGSQTAANLTRQLMAYSGKVQLKPRELDINQIIEEIQLLLRASVPKEVVLELNLTPGLPAVKVDATQLQQVIMNLIVNAAEAIAEHQTGWVKASTGAREGKVFIEVKDSGSGMSEEVMAKIFDPFFTTKFAGRGLGLAAAQGIVRAQHGSLTVESAAGAGSTFLVSLPALAKTLRSPTPPAETRTQPKTQGAILIVDDEELIRRMVAELLQDYGFSSITAESARVAIEIASRRDVPISLALLDWMMPGARGAETLRTLRNLRPAMPIIISSGYSEPSVAEHLADEAVAFIQKPYSPEDLLTLIEARTRPLTSRSKTRVRTAT